MTPFDLKRALAGEPVVTRSGNPVDTLVWFSKVHDIRRLRGVCHGQVESWDDNGRYLGERETSMDLFMAEPVRDRVKSVGPVVSALRGMSTDDLLLIITEMAEMLLEIREKIPFNNKGHVKITEVFKKGDVL